MNSLEFEERVIHKVGEEEDLKAVDAFLDSHAVHEAASKGSPSQKRALVRKILCEEVFISSAMLKATDLALVAHAEDPKAKAFFAAMKEAFLETDSTLAATLAAAFDVTPQQVVAEYPPSSKCQAFSTAFTWLLVTQSPATSAMAMRVNFATWRKMCRSILGATRSATKNAYLEKFATAPEKEDQGFDEHVFALLREAKEKGSFDYKETVQAIKILQFAESIFFDGVIQEATSEL